ncbi:MAG: hypothetical protein ACREQY_06015 [Candidatus Binatia bacterium]
MESPSRVVSFFAPEGCTLSVDDGDDFLADRDLEVNDSLVPPAEVFAFCELGTNDVDPSLTLADVTCGDGVCNAGEVGSCPDCLCINADDCDGPPGDACSCQQGCEFDVPAPCCPDAAPVCGASGFECGDGECNRFLETCDDPNFESEAAIECLADCGSCANDCADGKCDPAEHAAGCTDDCTCTATLSCEGQAAPGGGCVCTAGCDNQAPCCFDAEDVCDPQ